MNVKNAIAKLRKTYLVECQRELYTTDESLAAFNGALLMLKELNLVDDDTFRNELMSFVDELD